MIVPERAPETLVLLHGFAGTRRTWDRLIGALDPQRYRPLALDLPGHGAAAAHRPVSFASCVAATIEDAPSRFTLCGYSMGARIALHVALAHPGRVRRLILIGANPGIEDPEQRAERRTADERLADRIEREGDIESFAERWRTQPLFAEDPAWLTALAREDYLRNRPGGLAASLRGVGAGAMEPLWGRLAELGMPVLAVAGSRDDRYRRLGQRLVDAVPDGGLLVIGGGHALHLESPREMARVLRSQT